MLQSRVELETYSANNNNNYHVEKKDAMKVWEEMKQNGFLTPSFTHMPSLPQKQSKKRRNNNFKTSNSKRELAKMQEEEEINFCFIKEHDIGVINVMPKKRTKRCLIDRQKPKNFKVAKVQELNRFTKVAAEPSGLLNEVNPGIINRMRSSEQVFSIISALIRRDEIGVSNDQNRCEGKKFGKNNRKEFSNCLSRSGQLEICAGTAGRLSFTTAKHKGVAVSDLGSPMIKIENENGRDEVKSSLASSVILETASSSHSNENSANKASVSSLSQQGTTLASQWLQFLHRDVTNRLAALSRSQMRVQDVIQTELPFLLAKEFSLSPEHEQWPAAGCPISVSMDMHQAKWNSMFHQMDEALKEEANRLEHWLNQVREIQSDNNHDYQFYDWHARHFLNNQDQSVTPGENSLNCIFELINMSRRPISEDKSKPKLPTKLNQY